MISPRVAYRARQFWNALLRPNEAVRTEALLPTLTPAQLLLFRRMQPSEQIHAYKVFRTLLDDGSTDPDLLAAALLHDVGKILSPLSVLDRVIIVLGGHIFPNAVRRWGAAEARGWRRPFVVATHHAEWGADLAEQAGASPMVVRLIRRHQETSINEPAGDEDRLLAQLRAADDGN
jgi:putative nucleotidyltransferase with HDIG domain